MKTNRLLIAALLAVTLAGSLLNTVAAPAESLSNAPVESLSKYATTPQFIVRHATELDLSGEQRQALQREMRTATRPQFERLMRESKALAELTAVDKADEGAILAQLDKVLEVEREMKRARLQMSLRARAHLTPEQRAKLQNLRPAGEGGALNGYAAFTAKMQRVHQAVKRAKAERRDLTKMRELWARFQSVRADGNPAETMRVLDEALALLEGASVQQNP